MENSQNLIKDKKNFESIIESLKLLRSEVLELYLPKHVPILHEIPEPFEFYRKWVAPNIPVLIKGGVKHWVAIEKWKKEYFREKLGDKKISVSVTPNGYADAITEIKVDGIPTEVFVLPDEKQMTMSEFYTVLDSSDKSNGVFYIQKQNSNLTEEFPELLPDIDSELSWASETFCCKPSAINLWIGDQRAVTSLHKDPFENIYCVVSGYKEFILFPPTDRPWLKYKNVPVGHYTETNPGVFEVNVFQSDNWVTNDRSGEFSQRCSTHSGENRVPWIAVDPDNPDFTKYPLYKFASPLRVKVEAGDALYLPSLWFHHVKQSDQCVAVNYWYDMNFDIKYAYFQWLENLTKTFDDLV